MLLLSLLLAHAQTFDRELVIQPRADASVSLLVAFRFSAGATESFLRLQADSNHDGSVSHAEAQIVVAAWLQSANADLVLEGDGQPAECSDTFSAPELEGSIDNRGFSILELRECKAALHFSLTTFGNLPTSMHFSPASVSADAVCNDCLSEASSPRRAEWFYLPGRFALSGN